MASLAELQDALQNAHAAGDEDAARALADEIVRQRMPWSAPTNVPIPQGAGPLSVLPSGLQAGVIGAGRASDQVVQGVKQAGLAGLTALKGALNMDARPQLDAMRNMDAQQAQNSAIYGALKQQFPFSTSVGEAAPSLAIPMGQATVAARVMAPAIGMGALGAAQYGSPLERGIRGTADALGGLVGGTTSELASRLVQPVRSVASSAAQNAAKQAANQIGAPLLPSQQTGSVDLARVEDALARYPGSAGVMNDFLSKQRNAVNLTAARAIGQADAPTAAVRQAAKADLGAQYDAFRAQIPNGVPVTQPIFDAVDNAISALSKGSANAPGKADGLSMLNELKDKLYQSKSLTPDEYSSWVSDLAAKARQVQNPTVSAQLKSVGGALDQAARGPLNPDWQKLDQSYAALKVLGRPNVVNDATGDVNPGAVARMLKSRPTGANATPLSDIADYYNLVPNLRAGSPTAEREAVSIPGALNALWRYPLAKVITSEAMRDYLSRGLLANPKASEFGALLAGKAALPLSMTPAMGLLGSIVPAYQ